MNEESYKKALETSKYNIGRISKEVPFSIRQREELFFDKVLKSKHSAIKKLEMLYAEMDVVYGALSNIVICKRGCSHCCKYSVNLSELEVEFIKKKGKINKKKLIAGTDNCPFLKDNKCSIYAYRPYMCRAYVSVTDSPDWCKTDVAFSYEFDLLRFSEFDKAYLYITGINPDIDGLTIKDVFVKG